MIETPLMEYASHSAEVTGPLPDIVDNFRSAFLESGIQSIDAFLEYRPEYMNIGKAAIAICLIRRQQLSNLIYKPWFPGVSWYE